MAKVIAWDDTEKGFKEINVTEGGGGPETVVTKTSDYTVTTDDKVILCDCSSGDITLTLPAVSGLNGTRFYIKKIDSSSNIVTIVPDSTELIEGDDSYTIEYQNTAIELILFNNWWVN